MLHAPVSSCAGKRIGHKEHIERKEEDGNVLIYVFFVFSVAIPFWT